MNLTNADLAAALHRKYLVVDSHCDTPMLFADDPSYDIGVLDHRLKVDIPKMELGGLDMAIVVAYLPQLGRDSESLDKASKRAQSILGSIKKQVSNNRSNVTLVTDFAQAEKAKQQGLRSIMLGLENGYAIGADLRNLDLFYGLGVRYMTLCHNGDNDICDSCAGRQEHGGLSDFGRMVIGRMNSIGMVVDISHASYRSALQAVALSARPVIASHSGACGVFDHPRNLPDDVIRAVASGGGVVQVCGYHGFLAVSEADASVRNMVDHIDYIVGLVGEDHVGVGSDFDGGGGVRDFEDASQAMNLTAELLERGYTQEQVAKIWSGNLRRAMQLL